MALDDRRMYAIDLMATGNYTISEIGDMVGVSRQSIWAWKKEPEFKAELDSRLTAITQEANERLKARLMPVMDELLKMALSDKTDARTKAQCLQYIANRVCGSPTSSANIEIDNKTDTQSTDALAEFHAFLAQQEGKHEENKAE